VFSIAFNAFQQMATFKSLQLNWPSSSGSALGTLESALNFNPALLSPEVEHRLPPTRTHHDQRPRRCVRH
jgi:hypothetical protein